MACPMAAPAMPSQQTLVRMLKRPVGHIVPGQDLVAVREACPAAADLKEGQVLLHRLFLSLDPAMRGWMRDLPSCAPLSAAARKKIPAPACSCAAPPSPLPSRAALRLASALRTEIYA